jgi:nucleoside-diphosphate-sugar epimerase
VTVPGFPSDIRRRVPDVRKAAELLGWRSEITLDEGLKDVLGS